MILKAKNVKCSSSLKMFVYPNNIPSYREKSPVTIKLKRHSTKGQQNCGYLDTCHLTWPTIVPWYPFNNRKVSSHIPTTILLQALRSAFLPHTIIILLLPIAILRAPNFIWILFRVLLRTMTESYHQLGFMLPHHYKDIVSHGFPGK